MSSNAHGYGARDASAPDDTGTDAARGRGAPRALNEDQDASSAAARLLEMTARETDQWRSDARSEAAAIVADAREESAELMRAAREEAGRLVTSAREEAAQEANDARVEANDARVEAYRVREETAAVRKRHDEDIAGLQQVEAEHRERLQQHLTEMLDRVRSGPRESGR